MGNLLDNKEYAIGTYKDNEVIGGCYFHRFENTLMIDQLFVKEKYQNHNIGTNLINSLFVYKQGIEKLVDGQVVLCRISANNDKAKSLYKKLGFRETKSDTDTLVKSMM